MKRNWRAQHGALDAVRRFAVADLRRGTRLQASLASHRVRQLRHRRRSQPAREAARPGRTSPMPPALRAFPVSFFQLQG